MDNQRRIGAYGLSYAGLTGLFFMFGLFGLDDVGIRRFETQATLGLSVVILAISSVLYQEYLFKKGGQKGGILNSLKR